MGPDEKDVTFTPAVPASLNISKVFAVVFFTVTIVSLDTATLSIL